MVSAPQEAFVSRKVGQSGPYPADFPGSDAAVSLDGVDLWVAGVEGHVDLLRRVTWRAEQGEHWAVLGANGAGKSSLLSIVGAMRHPSRGSAWVLGAQLGRVDLRALRERIGVVDAVTGSRVPKVLSLLDVALTGASGTVLPRPEVYDDQDRARAADEIDRVGLKALAHRRFGDCSQGERQRALLARALVGRPELLLLDEAAVGLDLPAREALLAALISAASDAPERATITVTHHVEELPQTTTHALLIRAGSTIAAGPLEDVLTSDGLSECFGLPVSVARLGDRWAAHATAGWRP
jgi:iron complex transport system ATP-binding protein